MLIIHFNKSNQVCVAAAWCTFEIEMAGGKKQIIEKKEK